MTTKRILKEGDKYNYKLFTIGNTLLVRVPMIVERGCIVSTAAGKILENGTAHHFKVFDSSEGVVLEGRISKGNLMNMSYVCMVSGSTLTLE